MVSSFLMGTIGAPVFGIIFGYEWWIILLLAVIGGPLGILTELRLGVIRDLFGRRRSESSDGDSMDSRDESAYVSQTTLRLVVMAIVAFVATVVIVALIVNR